MHYPTASPMAWADTSACNYSCGRCVAGLKNLGLVSCGLNWTELNWTDSDLKNSLFLSCALVELMCISLRKNFELYHQIQRFTESCGAVHCILECVDAEKNLKSRLIIIYVFLVFLDCMSWETRLWRGSWATKELHTAGAWAGAQNLGCCQHFCIHMEVQLWRFCPETLWCPEWLQGLQPQRYSRPHKPLYLSLHRAGGLSRWPILFYDAISSLFSFL